MVRFGQQLQEEAKQEWADMYVDYVRLKQQLRRLRANRQDRRGSEAEREIIDTQEAEFSKLLDEEIEKVVLFFLAKQGELAERLRDLRQRNVQLEQQTVDHIDQLITLYRSAGEELIELLQYLELNITAVRKILKKHDKQTSSRLAPEYLQSRIGETYSQLLQLYHHEGLSALIGTVRKALHNLHLERQHLLGNRRRHLDRRISELEPVLVSISEARERVLSSRRRTIEDYIGTHSDLAVEISVREHQDLLRGKAFAKAKQESMRTDNRGLNINLWCTFLYMTNYYVVGPTSTEYAKKLGLDESLSGLIIGMTPIAAMVSCVLYSWWTNDNFKSPLLFSTVMLVVGNLFYALAYQLDSVTLIMLGRLLNGIGGARGINRRYIADHVSLLDRTHASSAFVAVGAIGMASGPLLAGLISLFPITFTLAASFLDQHQVVIAEVNPLTSPGWVMALLWIMFGVVVIVYFDEPSKEAASYNIREATDLEGGEPDATTGLLSEGRERQPQPHQSYGAISISTSDNNHDDADDDDDNNDTDTEEQRLEVMTTQSDLLSCGCWQYITLDLGLCLVLYFVDKYITEIVASSVPFLAKQRFGWSPADVGWFMGALGLLVLPTNIVVGKLSRTLEDRQMLLAVEAVAVLSLLLLVETHALPFTVAQYVIGATVLFVSLQAMEGVAMSILSKLISPELAKGTWNSGLLATEAGTFGRALGDIMISVVGTNVSREFINALFLPSLVCMVAVLLMSRQYYSLLTSR